MSKSKTDMKALLRSGVMREELEIIGEAKARVPSAEVHALAAICQDRDNNFTAFDEAAQLISDSSFDLNAHRAIWRAMRWSIEEHGTITQASIVERLRVKGELDNPVGGAEEVAALYAMDVSREELILHVRMIEDAAARRGLQEVGAQVARGGASMEIDEMQHNLEGALDRVRSAQGCGYRTTGEQIRDRYVSRLVKRSQRETREDFRLGFGIDDYIPAQHGRIYHVCGPEKAGKTTLALMMAAQAMKSHGAIVDIWTVEMTSDEIEDCLISALTGLSREGLEQGRFDLKPGTPMTPDEQHRFDTERETYGQRCARRLADALRLMEELDLHIHCTSDATVADIAAHAAVRHQQYRERIAAGTPHIVVVDYLQGVDPGVPTKGRTERIEQASQRLRAIAKTERVKGVKPPTLIVTAHTNRGLQGLPGAEDIFGSAQAAKDTDGMIIIARPGGDEERWTGHLDVNVARNRKKGVAGSTGVWALKIDMEHMQAERWSGPTWREVRAAASSDGDNQSGGFRGGRGGRWGR